MIKTWIGSQTIRIALALIFFLFICWIIYTADQGQVHPYLKQIRDFPYGDKIAHFTLYGLLALMVNLAINNKRIKVLNYQPLLGSFLIAVFAIVEEFTQIAFVTRNFELMDMLCDILGIGLFSKISLRFDLWVKGYRPEWPG